ncbi:MAG: discoidin domain-containing protein, partial [Victivallales bacterium]
MKKLLLLLVFLAFNVHGAVNGRYVRIENPTAPNMAWQEIEVFSGSRNMVLNKPKLFSGTGYTPERPVADFEGKRLVDGNKDTAQRGPDLRNGDNCNPWLEIDLGEPQSIDKIILYGSQYPNKLYLDKGHRLVSILDKDRKIVWIEKFDYYEQKKYVKGLFEFSPSSGQQNQLSGMLIPINTAGWVPMPWLLNIADEKAPSDAAKRMDAFKHRNAPENIKNLADELFNLLEPIPELAEARKLYADGKYAAALDAWKIYWFAKMKKVNQHSGYDAGAISYGTQGDDLFNGIRVTITSHSIGASRFTPGRINWVDLPKEPVELRSALADTSYLALVNVFGRELLKSYSNNGKSEYLRQWSGIMDDWCMNFFKDSDASEYNVKDLFVMIPANHWTVLMEELSDIAGKRPEFINEFPAATLARIQITCLDQYGPAY